MFEFQSSFNFPAGPLLTVILALVGRYYFSCILFLSFLKKINITTALNYLVLSPLQENILFFNE